MILPLRIHNQALNGFMVLGTGHVFGRVVIVAIGEMHEHIGYAGLPR